jgi:glycine/D-amino acid oxidase-like deaminating enzyme
LADVVLKKGGRLFPQTPLLSLEEKEGSLLLTTSQGNLSAHMVVLAANGYLTRVHPFFTGKIEPVRGQMIATEPVSKTIPPLAMLTNFGYEYWQQTPSGRFALGGMRWQAENADVGLLDDHPDPRLRIVLSDFLTKTFKDWGPFTVSHNWAGIMGFSQDGLPFLGKLPGRNNILVAGGFTGHGMAFGFLSGRVLAEIIQTGRTKQNIALFSPGRFL